MRAWASSLRMRASFLAALVLVALLYGFARPPRTSVDERAQLAARFRFARTTLAEPAGLPAYQTVRNVHPSLRRIDGWISTLGAAVALADLDGDGLSNDLCHVDARTDAVIVSPAPGTGARYAAFLLTVDTPATVDSPVDVSGAGALPYDAKTMAPMGCVPNDMNEDGLMDALVYYWGRTPVAFLRATGAPSTPAPLAARDYVAAEIVSSGERWYTNAVLFADLDGDGHTDLLVGNYFQDGARILDADADGVEAMHSTKSKSFNGGRKHLFLWERAAAAPAPAVRFREVPDVFQEDVDRGWLLAAAAADLDGDVKPEIYFAHDFGPDRLLRNDSTPGRPRFTRLEGERSFTTPASCVLGHDSFKGMGVDVGDVNGDGLFDLYVSNIADTFALVESHFLWLSTGETSRMRDGIAPYVHGSERLGLSRGGWGWDTRLADLDNDGRLDALQATGFLRGDVDRWPELQALGTANDRMMTNPRYWPGFRPGDDLSGHNRFNVFTRTNDGRFENIGPAIGFDEPMLSRGVAVADADGDGRLDFAVANQFEPSFFYRNESPRGGDFLGLHLLLPLEPGRATTHRRGHPAGDVAGRPAVGAVARVRRRDGSILIAQVDGGSGHSGKRSPDVHIGLGSTDADADAAAGGALTVELTWRDPDGRVHTEALRLEPGWHTVVLGWPARGGTS